MVRERVHHDGEGQDMTAHDENQEEHLSPTEHLAAYGTSHNFSCISHVVDVRIFQFELSDYVARVCCQDTQASDEYNARY